jgi:putative peptidoglycan lipid II flippase
MLAFVVVPASVGMVTLSVPIVGLLYERGRFGPDDTLMVAAILRAYGVGLLGYAAYFMLVRAFYSRQNTRTPALLNVGLLVLYCALAYGLSRTMLGLEGVAYALSGAYAVLAVALLVAMRRESGSLDGRRLLRSLTKILAAGATMYAVASVGVGLTGTGTNALDRAAVLVVVGGAAVASYLAAAHLLRADELKNVDSLVRRRKSSGG